MTEKLRVNVSLCVYACAHVRVHVLYKYEYYCITDRLLKCGRSFRHYLGQVTGKHYVTEASSR